MVAKKRGLGRGLDALLGGVDLTTTRSDDAKQKAAVDLMRRGKYQPRREMDEETVMNAPMIAWPLGLYDCCGVTDGGAAAIMCRTEDVNKYKPGGDYITIKAFGISSGPGMGKVLTDYDFTHWEEPKRACAQAYAEAGIKDPKKEIDMCEVHDCFSIAELMCYEDM